MEHFKKDLSKAVGVTETVAVIGVCFFAPYLEFLVNKFGLSGAFLLFAGATLHAVPAALFILLNKPFKQTLTCANKATSASEAENKITKENKVQEKNAVFLDTSCCNNSTLPIHQNGLYNQKVDKYGENCYINSIFLSKNCNDTELQIKTTFNKVNCSKASETVSWPKSDQWIDVPISSNYDKQNFSSHVSSVCENENYSVEASLTNLKNSEEPEQLHANKLMKTLFTHRIFWLLLICNGMHYFTLPAFFTLLIDYAMDIGIDPVNSKYIVIYCQCIEFISFPAFGYFVDLKLVSSNGFAVIFFLCEILSLVFMPWVQNVTSLALAVLIFQWGQTGLCLISPAVVSDSLEKEIQSSALASLFLLAAPLNLTISPLVGKKTMVISIILLVIKNMFKMFPKSNNCLSFLIYFSVIGRS